MMIRHEVRQDHLDAIRKRRAVLGTGGSFWIVGQEPPKPSRCAAAHRSIRGKCPVCGEYIA